MGFRHYSGILLPSSLYASVLQLAIYLYSLHLTKQSLSQQNKINWPLRCAILLVHDCLLQIDILIYTSNHSQSVVIA